MEGLNPGDALRVEYDVVPSSRGGTYRRPMWVFACRGCGREMRKQRGSLSKATGKCVRCVKRTRHPLQTLYNGFVSSVERQNRKRPTPVLLDLSFNEFLTLTVHQTCWYCHGPITWTEFGTGPYNLDRIDNNDGYRLGNVVVCCYTCNTMKREWYGGDEFEVITDLLRLWRAAGPETRRDLAFVIKAAAGRADLATTP